MGDLPERMHAGIRAPGTLHLHALAAKRFGRIGERTLHRQPVILHLPADERRAVIFDQQLVTGHAGLNRAACRA